MRHETREKLNADFASIMEDEEGYLNASKKELTRLIFAQDRLIRILELKAKISKFNKDDKSELDDSEMLLQRGGK